MRMSKNGDGFGFCFLAVCASESFDACFSFGRFFGNLSVIPSMTFCRDGCLFNENDGADGAFFTISQTCFGAGCILALDNGFGMTFGIDVAVNVGITARAGVSGVTLFGAGGCSNGCGIFMCMSKNGYGFRFGFPASTAGKDTETCFCFGRFFRDRAFAPSMSRCGNGLRLLQNLIAYGTGLFFGKSLFGASGELCIDRQNDVAGSFDCLRFLLSAGTASFMGTVFRTGCCFGYGPFAEDVFVRLGGFCFRRACCFFGTRGFRGACCFFGT